MATSQEMNTINNNKINKKINLNLFDEALTGKGNTMPNGAVISR